MNGDPTNGIEEIMRRNVAVLRSKANLTQQGLADEMLMRGIAWTRETVAQVETTSRRLGFTEAIVVAACLDVPVARLTATGQASVAVGESEWTAAYLGAAIAGTAGDIFPPESYAGPALADTQAPAHAEPPARSRRTRGGPRNGAAAPSDDGPVTATSRELDAAGRRTAGPSATTSPTEGGRAHRASAASAGDGQRRRRHRPTALVAEPRRRARAPGDRPACPHRWLAEDDPWSCLPRSRSGDRPRDGTPS